MKIRWAQFTDLHYIYKGKSAETNQLQHQLIKFLEGLKTELAFILISGDCLYQGTQDMDEIRQTADFIHKLATACGCEPANIYMTPGNHDLKRSDIRNVLISSYTGYDTQTKLRDKKKRKPFDEQANELLLSDFKSFFNLYTMSTGKNYGTEAHRYDESQNYRILNVNTCIMAGLDKKQDEGNLLVFNYQLVEKCKHFLNDNKLNIALMHHSFENLQDDDRKKFISLMDESNIDIVFSGHSHQIGVQSLSDTDTTRSIYSISCGAILSDNYSEPSFYICEYDTDKRKLMIALYNYSFDTLQWGKGVNKIRRFSEGDFVQDLTRDGLSKPWEPEEKQATIHFPTTKYFKQFGIENAVPMREFLQLRSQLISTAKGEITLAGQSLVNALDEKEDSRSLVDRLIKNKDITQIDILLCDPAVFDSSDNYGEINSLLSEDSPIKRISDSVETILEKIVPNLSSNQSINIYFIPLVQIDHIVLANDILLVRNTLLWSKNDIYKGAPLVCRKVEQRENIDSTVFDLSMYNVYKEYLRKLKDSCILINVNYNDSYDDETSLAKLCHHKWRAKVYELKNDCRFNRNINLYKLYHTQLINDLHSSWNSIYRNFSPQINWLENDEKQWFKPGKTIKSHVDLFKPENLINDPTQQMLLPYVKETEVLFDALVKRYDKKGSAYIIPSLDIGMPNNVLRLGGGFATGMMLVWKCGTPIVPVDTTVNVCSSSYYCFDRKYIKDIGITNFFNEQLILEIIRKGSEREGLAFSFSTGNHFLMLAQSRRTKKLYLILHSSAKQFKDSFLGLYPREKNWFSNSLKVLNASEITSKEINRQRYIRYLKDKEAIRFINLAQALNEQNKDIHNWFANEFLGDIYPLCSEKKTYHHYGMPTDYSIAIGTYVVDTDDIVPVFSRKGYPICMFRPNDSMWGIKLGKKVKHLVPHGWGQCLNLSGIDVTSDLILGIRNNCLEALCHNKTLFSYPIRPEKRFTTEQVYVRNLMPANSQKDGTAFQDIGRNYLEGDIVDILDPIAEFSKDEYLKEKGSVHYFYKPDGEREIFS